MFLNGREPCVETADAFLASLVAQGRANSCLSTLPPLRKYLGWKDPGVETRELYNRYGREYRRAHGYYEYLQRWHSKRMQVQKDGKLTWVDIPYRRAKPEKCEVCGKTAKRLSYHHWDNSDLSKGLWLCGRCHNTANAVEVASRCSDTVRRYLEMKGLAECDF